MRQRALVSRFFARHGVPPGRLCVHHGDRGNQKDYEDQRECHIKYAYAQVVDKRHLEQNLRDPRKEPARKKHGKAHPQGRKRRKV